MVDVVDGGRQAMGSPTYCLVLIINVIIVIPMTEYLQFTISA